ncbi:MAG: DUF475 domain-containing protein [Siphonobacter sp.]
MDFLHQVFGSDLKAAGFVILNLVLIESLLSVDNAAVLATMVMDLPKAERNKALKYGIIGAYLFRGLCLVAAAWLVKVWWLKPVGGIYLLYLCFNYFLGAKEKHEEEKIEKKESWFYKNTIGLLGKFWATVALVEIMDLAFSIDNVFAAVAFTDNIVLICTGVFIGILAMRFVAQSFVHLMERFSFLEAIAFIVIGLLGLKLTSSAICHFFQESAFCQMLETEQADLYVSIGTVALFGVPILTSLLFNVPKHRSSHK